MIRVIVFAVLGLFPISGFAQVEPNVNPPDYAPTPGAELNRDSYEAQTRHELQMWEWRLQSQDRNLSQIERNQLRQDLTRAELDWQRMVQSPPQNFNLRQMELETAQQRLSQQYNQAVR